MSRLLVLVSVEGGGSRDLRQDVSHCSVWTVVSLPFSFTSQWLSCARSPHAGRVLQASGREEAGDNPPVPPPPRLGTLSQLLPAFSKDDSPVPT